MAITVVNVEPRQPKTGLYEDDKSKTSHCLKLGLASKSRWRVGASRLSISNKLIKSFPPWQIYNWWPLSLLPCMQTERVSIEPKKHGNIKCKNLIHAQPWVRVDQPSMWSAHCWDVFILFWPTSMPATAANILAMMTIMLAHYRHSPRQLSFVVCLRQWDCS